jgi:DNA-binding PadR family transcriptional regulator
VSSIKQTRISPEFVLLGFLYQYPCHGYDLHRRLEQEFGFIWHLSQSQTYNILKRLSSQGYINAALVKQEKLPSRQLFHLSESGMQRFNTWLAAPTRCSVHAIRVEFITRLYFIQLYQPEKIQETIYLQYQDVKKGLSRLEELRKHFPEDQVFNYLALDMRIRLLNSILSWLNECQNIIETKKSDCHA